MDPFSTIQFRNTLGKMPSYKKLFNTFRKNGQQKLSNARVKPYSCCKHPLSIIDGCLVKHGEETMRVAIQSAIRQLLLVQLHRAHVGFARMRKLTHRYISWSGIDRDIYCDVCALHRNSLPTVPLHLWEFPDSSCQRLHPDFARPFKVLCTL